ncbi:MAG: hypothetical protein RJQ14_09840 [Marinoscillum sp.]
MKNLIFVVFTLISSLILAQCPREDLVALMDIAKEVKEKLMTEFWEEWKDVPMITLLIDGQSEFLINHNPTSDSSFHRACGHLSRAAGFNDNLLATFPLIEGKPTIVMGTPEKTHKSAVGWTATLLHEHFHQLQFSKPNYFTVQKALNLDKGDQTGMWMLNYDFPYEEAAVNEQFKRLANTLLSLDQSNDKEVLELYKNDKVKLKNMLSADDYKYLNLQLWQEGYARYVELELLRKWIDRFSEITQNTLTDTELIDELQANEALIINHLSSSSPKELRRIYFYALGAAEARLIARTNPAWKAQYFDQLFTTDHLMY